MNIEGSMTHRRRPKCSHGCGLDPHDVPMGSCPGRGRTPYQLVRALYKKYLGDEERRAEFVTVLRRMDSTLIVHALYKSGPICGRLRECAASTPPVIWPENEIWVGIRQGYLLTCPACISALPEVLILDDLRQGFEKISRALARE